MHSRIHTNPIGFMQRNWNIVAHHTNKAGPIYICTTKHTYCQRSQRAAHHDWLRFSLFDVENGRRLNGAPLNEAYIYMRICIRCTTHTAYCDEWKSD